jgi:hypothetical protein
MSPPYTPAHRRRSFLAGPLPRGGQPLGARAARVDAEAHAEEHGGCHAPCGSRGAIAVGFPVAAAIVGVLQRGEVSLAMASELCQCRSETSGCRHRGS